MTNRKQLDREKYTPEYLEDHGWVHEPIRTMPLVAWYHKGVRGQKTTLAKAIRLQKRYEKFTNWVIVNNRIHQYIEL